MAVDPGPKPSNDWKTIGNRNKDGNWVQQDSSGNVRVIKPDGSVTYHNNTGGSTPRDGHMPPPQSNPQESLRPEQPDGGSNVPVTVSTGSSSVSGNDPDTNAPEGTAATAQEALGARSDALNEKYGLGDYDTPSPDEALVARSQALNQQYGLGDDTQPLPGPIAPSVKDPMYGIDPPGKITGSGSPMNQRGMETAASQSASPTIGHAQSGLEARSEALNEAYGLGSSSSASSAPAWHVNPRWAAVDGTSSAAISAAGVDPGQVLETRPGANNNTLLRMKDGTYQSIESNGNVTSAGTWDNSQWAGSGYDTQVNTTGNTISPASPAVDSIGPPPIVEQPLTAGRLETSPLGAQGAAITSTDNSVLGGITLPASDTGGPSSAVDNYTPGENASAGRSIAD